MSYLLADGSRCTHADIPYGGQRHYMRIGRFAILAYGTRSLAIDEAYDDQLVDDGSIRPGSEYWAAHVADRTRQLDLVEERLPGHPLQAEVEEDIGIERGFLASDEQS